MNAVKQFSVRIPTPAEAAAKLEERRAKARAWAKENYRVLREQAAKHTEGTAPSRRLPS